MSNSYNLKITAEQAKEMPMVDLAFLILKEANEPFYYRDLMKEIAKIKGINDDQVMDVIAQLYTEINIDGRFACVGTNLWGLKRWYPVEKAEDPVGNTQRPRIINDDDDEEDEELFIDEVEDDLDDDDKELIDDFDDDDEEDLVDLDEDLDEELPDDDDERSDDELDDSMEDEEDGFDK